MNGRYRNAWLLCLTLLLVLWAVSGCQKQAPQEPTFSPSPEPSLAVGQEPSPSRSPEPSVTVEPEPTSSTSPEPSRVTVEQVKQWMDEGVPLAFLDSRSEASWRGSGTKLPGALRVPPDDVESHLSEIPRDRRIIVYCT
jgi:hypothetical protein